MEDTENKGKERGEIFSRAIRAGKRTYFFDVKTLLKTKLFWPYCKANGGLMIRENSFMKA